MGLIPYKVKNFSSKTSPKSRISKKINNKKGYVYYAWFFITPNRLSGVIYKRRSRILKNSFTMVKKFFFTHEHVKNEVEIFQKKFQ